MLLLDLLLTVAACLLCCCWISYRQSLPAFYVAVGSATESRCLPFMLLLDLLPTFTACILCCCWICYRHSLPAFSCCCWICYRQSLPAFDTAVPDAGSAYQMVTVYRILLYCK
ncbi:hypothetical protein TNCT_613131 [Trichonephila clavata]|uniref:Uncharacterized protein n=1 Tax=Trichonephila clavata TaxID=2740835 RepID=A0A8X6KFQ7_TRICU|nr:hypothetical protein TNCT_613131 [Trichonephila clavata]